MAKPIDACECVVVADQALVNAADALTNGENLFGPDSPNAVDRLLIAAALVQTVFDHGSERDANKHVEAWRLLDDKLYELRDALCAQTRARLATLRNERDEARSELFTARNRETELTAMLNAQVDSTRLAAGQAIEALTRAEAAERERHAFFDCHGGPGTTSDACGACTTCLIRERDTLAAHVERQHTTLVAVRDWRGLDGDGITDPVRGLVITAVAAAPTASLAAHDAALFTEHARFLREMHPQTLENAIHATENRAAVLRCEHERAIATASGVVCPTCDDGKSPLDSNGQMETIVPNGHAELLAEIERLRAALRDVMPPNHFGSQQDSAPCNATCAPDDKDGMHVHRPDMARADGFVADVCTAGPDGCQRCICLTALAGSTKA